MEIRDAAWVRQPLIDRPGVKRSPNEQGCFRFAVMIQVSDGGLNDRPGCRALPDGLTGLVYCQATTGKQQSFKGAILVEVGFSNRLY